MPSETARVELAERLRVVLDSQTPRDIARITGSSEHDVSQYKLGRHPTIEFCSTLCAAMGISTEWLLLGVGPMQQQDVAAAALGQASMEDLLRAVALLDRNSASRVRLLESEVARLSRNQACSD